MPLIHALHCTIFSFFITIIDTFKKVYQLNWLIRTHVIVFPDITPWCTLQFTVGEEAKKKAEAAKKAAEAVLNEAKEAALAAKDQAEKAFKDAQETVQAVAQNAAEKARSVFNSTHVRQHSTYRYFRACV